MQGKFQEISRLDSKLNYVSKPQDIIRKTFGLEKNATNKEYTRT